MSKAKSISPMRAAPASVWGKGVPGKGGRTTNAEITDEDRARKKKAGRKGGRGDEH